MSIGPDFFQTRLGRIFYENHVPTATKALQSIAVELKRANDLKEHELNGTKPGDSNEQK